ncbi:hypothetical protein MLD38_034709 [Melastoma candidum]|uniref:Uncharacterized protein n=1 Tax=Melastoma candidum TaxID=119954 RepID=A0ACB9MAS1_9MYRT|nr:hypothetical protein MLD38_034709 [Melastoma candidum]
MELETGANGLVTTPTNWSEEVEDLVSAGDVDGAISLLESVVAGLESLRCPDRDRQSTSLQLSSALTELSRLFASRGFSLKSDEVAARASVARHRALQDFPSRGAPIGKERKGEDGDGVVSTSLPAGAGADVQESKGLLTGDDVGSACNETSDDDWEVIADRAPNELLPAEGLPNVAKLSLPNDKLPVPKRRGRGTFTYQKQKLYSDRPLDNSDGDGEGVKVVDEDLDRKTGSNSRERHNDYGTRHILVLAGFPPTTRTLDLEKLLEDFKSHGVVIRWVNDTTALAVFRTAALAHEALNSIHFPFTVREVNEDDDFITTISAAELEPPRPRPPTSTRTAQRLIAQGMGLKLPSTSFGSRELRKQEEARKNRIVRRQKLKDDAWGED